jgi:hypothetical protein
MFILLCKCLSVLAYYTASGIEYIEYIFENEDLMYTCHFPFWIRLWLYALEY